MATIHKERRGIRRTVRTLATGELRVLGMENNRLRLELRDLDPVIYVITLSDSELRRLKNYIS